MVHRGDSQDISAFPHACARVYAYVCRFIVISQNGLALPCLILTMICEIKSLQCCLAGICSSVSYSLLLQLHD